MKSHLLALFALSAALATAQTTTVPVLMSYQGRVTDSAGALIGNSAPVNRTVQFKIYTLASGGTPIWAESQTVTISGGEFSVLIGNGSGISGYNGPSAPGISPPKTLSDIINSASTNLLYLGVTVDDGNAGTVDAEISPRQQIVSGAFALRARVAETIASGALTASMIGDSAITTNAINASAVTTAKLNDQAVTTAKIADGTIATADLANSSVTAAKLDTSTIGLWSVNGSNVYRSSGNVGIGTSSPNFPLSFADGVGDKISLSGQSGASYGLGIQPALLQLHTDAAGADIAFGWGSSASFNETMRVRGNGNVGIATQTPYAKLQVNGAIASTGNVSTHGAGAFLEWNKDNGSGRTYLLNQKSAGWGGFIIGEVDTGNAITTRLSINSSGHVGIGTENPGDMLTLNNGWVNVGSTDGVDIGIRGTMAGNDTWSIYGAGSSDNGALIIKTGDNATEPIQFYQNTNYLGGFNSAGNFEVNGRMFQINSSYNGSSSSAQWSFNSSGGQMQFIVYNTSLNRTATKTISFDGDSNWDFYSDARLKKDVRDAEPMLDRLMQVRFVRYHWLEDDPAAKFEFGVIAQELEPLFPQIVGEGIPTGGTEPRKTVGYTEFATIAAKALQEYKHRTDADLAGLRADLAAKDARIASLEERLAALERLLTSSK